MRVGDYDPIAHPRLSWHGGPASFRKLPEETTSQSFTGTNGHDFTPALGGMAGGTSTTP